MIDCLEGINPVLLAFLATLFTYGITMLGASLVFFFKDVKKSVMDAMLGFAAGVMIAASFFSLLGSSIEMVDSLGMKSHIITFVGFFSGGVLLFIGDKLFNYFDKKIISNKDDKDRKSFKRCLMLIFSITLHNIPEGLAVGVAFGSTFYGLEGASVMSAIVIAIGIGLQNFPEGSAVALPLRREGMSRKRAFFFGQLSAIVEPISGVIGALLVLKIRYLLPFLLAFAAGCMIYVVIEELIPESQTNEKKDLMALFSIIGFSIMMILDVTLG